jgi:hypothetical protein
MAPIVTRGAEAYPLNLAGLRPAARDVLATVARLRGLDPDRPPHLRKVTETV